MIYKGFWEVQTLPCNRPKLKKGVLFRKMREQDRQNSIRLALNPYAIIFRGNVGKVRLPDGRYFDTGLPKGFPDLFGFRKSDGKMIFLEVKTDKGRLREKQAHFLDTMSQYPVIHGVARSDKEAIKIVLEG